MSIWERLLVAVIAVKIVVSGVVLYKRNGVFGIAHKEASAQAPTPEDSSRLTGTIPPKPGKEISLEELLRILKERDELVIKRALPPEEEIRGAEVLKALEDRQKSLTKKDEELRHREQRLAQLKLEIENRVKELSGLKSELQGLIQKREVVVEENLRRLAKIYDQTPPEEAAKIMDALPVEVASDIFLRMKERSAGRIKAAMDAEKARLVDLEIAKKR
ncbi:MAG: hypothetical protein HYT87_03470 [Nitrospirae bacterium]|nr:hypothetical protein [Nitrospirota bacterium]